MSKEWIYAGLLVFASVIFYLNGYLSGLLRGRNDLDVELRTSDYEPLRHDSNGQPSELADCADDSPDRQRCFGSMTPPCRQKTSVRQRWSRLQQSAPYRK